MKELSLKDLTIEQKLGMVMTGHIFQNGMTENNKYAYDLMKKRALGAIWVDPTLESHKEIIAEIRKSADYPILIICDAESGIGENKIGQHNALACTGKPEYAYAFGKVTGVTARKMGYNVICNPVIDMVSSNSVCGATVRSMGGNKYKVTELAIAEAQGLKDGGVLTVGKHYPGGERADLIDSHMAETSVDMTKEQLIDYSLYPYIELNKRGLLDGIMTRHARFINIDNEFPASLSKKVIDIIREQGFDGFAITDALIMMGIAAKFGASAGSWLAVSAGNDLTLPWYSNKDGYDALCEGYKKGAISEERLDEAVRRVLEAQHKTLAEPKYTDLTEEDITTFNNINKDGVFAKTDEGISASLDPDKKHFFAVLKKNIYNPEDEGFANVDTMNRSWYCPEEITEILLSKFRNSKVVTLSQYPSPMQNTRVLEESAGYDDIIFITFIESQAYVGRECLTSRVVSLIEALQVTDRVSTVVHFGNPFVLEDLVHIPRILIGGVSTESVNSALDVLSGEYEAKGTLAYDVKFK